MQHWWEKNCVSIYSTWGGRYLGSPTGSGTFPSKVASLSADPFSLGSPSPMTCMPPALGWGTMRSGGRRTRAIWAKTDAMRVSPSSGRGIMGNRVVGTAAYFLHVPNDAHPKHGFVQANATLTDQNKTSQQHGDSNRSRRTSERNGIYIGQQCGHTRFMSRVSKIMSTPMESFRHL